MSLDTYDIKRLAKELPEIFLDYKLVVTTRTNIQDSTGPGIPTKHETVVEYTIKAK